MYVALPRAVEDEVLWRGEGRYSRETSVFEFEVPGYDPGEGGAVGDSRRRHTLVPSPARFLVDVFDRVGEMGAGDV
jgi:hypothetical protein